MLHYSLTVLSLTKKQRGISCFDVGFGYWEIWLGLIYDFFFLVSHSSGFKLNQTLTKYLE